MEDTNLNPESWHVRLYLLNLDILEEFFSIGVGERMRNHPNLCSYFWITLGVMPAFLLVNCLLFWFVVHVFLVYPFQKYGVLGLFLSLLALGLIIGVPFLLHQLKQNAVQRQARNIVPTEAVKPESLSVAPLESGEPVSQQPGPGLVSVGWGWLLAKKQRICPVLTIGNVESTEGVSL